MSDAAAGTGGRSRSRALVALVLLIGVATGLAGCASSGSRGAGSPRSEPGAASSATAPPSVAVPARTGRTSSWQDGLAVRMPADVAGWSPAGCAATPPAAGWLRREDDQPGTVGFQVPADGEPSGPVVGYLDRTSVACGQSVTVHLSGPSCRVRLEAYRIGAYQRSTARLVWSSAEVPVRLQPQPAVQPVTHLIEPDWPADLTVPVTASWPAGMYLLVPRSAGGVVGPGIPLVVRDDAGGEPVLFAASTMTWNAYDDWQGYSLYRGPGGSAAAMYLSRAKIASFRRPLVGGGYRQLVFMDLPVVRELERSGLDVAYTTDVALDARPSVLLRHAELVLGGHSEYWTRREYDGMEAARNAGVNLVFLGANNLWWHSRLAARPAGAVLRARPAPSPSSPSPSSPSPSGSSWSQAPAAGAEPDREVVWRELAGDPTPNSRREDYTLLWSQWPEHRDGAAVLGQSHAGISVHGGYQLLHAPAWMLAGTGLKDGGLLPMAVGNEADGYNALAANPPDLTVVAAGVLRGANGPVTASVSYYSAPSGAGVFVAGSTDWSCGLEGSCFDQQVPATTSAALRGVTRNVLLAFAQPRAGLTRPSVLSVPPPPAVLLASLSPSAIGTYGGSESSEEGAAHAPHHRPGGHERPTVK